MSASSSTASRARLPANFPPSSAGQHERVPSTASSTGAGAQPAPYPGSPVPSSAGLSAYQPGSRQVSGGAAASRPPAASGAGAAAGRTDGERQNIARVYWEELADFLADFLRREPPNARINAREKLTRLNKQQFHELSTDVYDELVRRRSADPESVPYLPIKEEFHPKRNAARQKLASLTKNRFKDLASDVFHELQRRNPAFVQEQQQQHEENEEGEREELQENDVRHPAEAQNGKVPTRAVDMSRSRSTSAASENPYFPPVEPIRPPSRQQQLQQARDRSGSVSTAQSAAASQAQSRHRATGSISSVASARGPPLQVVNDPFAANGTSSFHGRQASYSGRPVVSSVVPSIVRPPSPIASSQDLAASVRSGNPPKQSVQQSTVVPATSTIAVEEISVPFSRDSEYVTSDSGGMLGDIPPSPGLTDRGKDGGEAGDRTSFSSAASRARGLGMATALGVHMAGSSGGPAPPVARDRAADDVRAEYEARLSEQAKRTQALEEELERARRALRVEQDERQRAESSAQAADQSISGIRRELHDAHAALQREKSRADALETATLARANPPATDGRHAASEEDGLLCAQVRDLMDELKKLALDNDELRARVDTEREAVGAADARAREMEKKWKAAKTELRNLKATSQMFVTAPRSKDHLPASKNGALADVHVTAFQTAIDGLITAARSTAPTTTIGAMKPVIAAMGDISRDVELFEARPPAERAHVDDANLRELKQRSTAALGALAHAAKEFGISYGLSPISLLDAAASELAAAVVGLFKLLGIRRAAKDVDYRSDLAAMQEAPYSDEDERTPPPAEFNGTFQFPRGGGDSRPPLANRQSSEGSSNDVRDSTITARPHPPSPPTGRAKGDVDPASNAYRLTSSSSIGSSSSAFDLERKASLADTDSSGGGGGKSYAGAPGLQGTNGWNPSPRPGWDSRPTNGFRSPFDEREDQGENGDEGADEHGWQQLRPYLESQSASLVEAIQTLLAAIRSGAPATVLRETLSTAIVLGSSIVGVSKDALPLRALGEGRRLLRELAGNCEMLSELSEGEDMGKDVRNQIATTTFDLAKNLKALLAL